ncbi:MAG: hypothetical protein WCL27_18945, partial [Betaproteobacteria bacterium]
MMMQGNATTAPCAHTTAKITTEELAVRLRIVPNTPRAALCRKGHYLGMRPVKLPNGKLLWAAAEFESL